MVSFQFAAEWYMRLSITLAVGRMFHPVMCSGVFIQVVPQ